MFRVTKDLDRIVLRWQALLKPGLDCVTAGRVVVEKYLELTPCFPQSLLLEQALDQEHSRLMVRRVKAEGIARGFDRRVPFLTLGVKDGDYLVVVRSKRIDRDGPCEVVERLVALPRLGRPGRGGDQRFFSVGSRCQRGPEGRQ